MSTSPPSPTSPGPTPPPEPAPAPATQRTGAGSAMPPPEPVPDLAEDTATLALAGALRSSFTIVKFIMGGLVLVFLFSGFFTVRPQERAIILRFGVPVGAGEGKL